MKISYNENFDYIVEFIRSTQRRIDLMELIQFCCDNKSYKDLYLNWHIFVDLINEHNSQYA